MHAAAASSAILCLALAFAGCGGDDGDTSQTPSGAAAARETVDIASFKYAPAEIRVRTGAKLTFVNKDDAPHTAQVEGPGGFDTKRLDRGDRATVTADKPGKITYFCIYHRFMEGTVDVVE